MKESFILLSLFFVLLNLFDVALTQYALSTGRFAELNPFLSSRINLLLIIKAIGITAIIGLAYYTQNKFKSFNPLLVVSSFYIVVVLWNIYQIFIR